MNRAERRRHDRLVVKRGENVVVTGTGQIVRVDDVNFSKLGAKQVGRHRWVTTVAYATPAPGAPGPKMCDDSNMLYVGTGCWDCEQPWSHALEEQPCPAAGDD